MKKQPGYNIRVHIKTGFNETLKEKLTLKLPLHLRKK